MQTKSDADDADADGTHTKNNMSPTPSEGEHNYKLSYDYVLLNIFEAEGLLSGHRFPPQALCLLYLLTVLLSLRPQYSLSTLGPFHVFFHLTGDV